MQRLLAAVRSTGMRAAVSRNAGAYLCNYAYWRAVEAAAQTGVPRFVAFVHVPPLRMKALPRRAVRHPHSLAQLTRGGEAILLAIPAILRGSTRRA